MGTSLAQIRRLSRRRGAPAGRLARCGRNATIALRRAAAERHRLA